MRERRRKHYAQKRRREGKLPFEFLLLPPNGEIGKKRGKWWNFLLPLSHASYVSHSFIQKVLYIREESHFCGWKHYHSPHLFLESMFLPETLMRATNFPNCSETPFSPLRKATLNLDDLFRPPIELPVVPPRLSSLPRRLLRRRLRLRSRKIKLYNCRQQVCFNT